MTIPNAALSVPAWPATLPAVDARLNNRRTVDYERGGIAFQDGTQGLNVRDWRIRLVGNAVRLSGDPYDTEITLFSAPGITELSLAFDGNMNVTVAYMAQNQCKLYWYDTTISAMTTSTLTDGISSPFLTFDDKRQSAIEANTADILLLYILGNRLCWRQQRERFSVERTLRWFVGNQVSIARCGMSQGMRLQIEVNGMTNPALPRAYMTGWTAASYGAPGNPTLAVTTIAGTTPAGLRAGDGLYAVLMTRSAATPPAGWTLVTAQACTAGGVTQTLSLFAKTSVAPADSSVSVTFTQATSNKMGIAMFAVRAESGTPSLLGFAGAAVNATVTNTITPAALTCATVQGELFVLLASSINGLTTATTDTATPTGSTLWSGAVAETRIAGAYQLMDGAASNTGSFTFALGTATNNGLAALTLRFGVADPLLLIY